MPCYYIFLKDNMHQQIFSDMHEGVFMRVIFVVGLLPEDVGKLKKLETLTLHHNALSSIPKSLSQLSHLRDLDLSYNRIAAFPVHLSALKNLDSLNLSHNKLSGALPDIAGLQLVELNLNNNQVSEFKVIFSLGEEGERESVCMCVCMHACLKRFLCICIWMYTCIQI